MVRERRSRLYRYSFLKAAAGGERATSALARSLARGGSAQRESGGRSRCGKDTDGGGKESN